MLVACIMYFVFFLRHGGHFVFKFAFLIRIKVFNFNKLILVEIYAFMNTYGWMVEKIGGWGST